MQMLDLLDEFSVEQMQAMVWAWNCVATQMRPISKKLPTSIVTIELGTLPFCDAFTVFLAAMDHYDWTDNVLFDLTEDFLKRERLRHCIKIFQRNWPEPVPLVMKNAFSIDPKRLASSEKLDADE